MGALDRILHETRATTEVNEGQQGKEGLVVSTAIH